MAESIATSSLQTTRHAIDPTSLYYARNLQIVALLDKLMTMAARKENLPPMVLLPPASPIRPLSPSLKPSLALQRDHSACEHASHAPLMIRKTRQNQLESTTEIPPPCQGCTVVPHRQKSLSRRVLSAVRQGLVGRNEDLQPSNTATTVSTTELVNGFGTSATPETTIVSTVSDSSSILGITAGSSLSLAKPDQLLIPYLDIQVVSDTPRIDMHAKQDIWIAIIATVKLQLMNSNGQETTSIPTTSSGKIIGEIPSMRIHIQAAEPSRIIQTLGDKTAKCLKPDDTVDLFVRLRVPPHRRIASEMSADLEAAYIEVESMLGTLETDMLYIEARYRHTMIGGSGSVSVRRTAKIKRSDPHSSWDLAIQTSESCEKKLLHDKMSLWIENHANAIGPPWM